MSPCPCCEQPGRHVAIVVPVEDGPAIQVEHRCVTDWCPQVGTFWRETAREPADALRAALWWREDTKTLGIVEDEPHV